MISKTGIYHYCLHFLASKSTNNYGSTIKAVTSVTTLRTQKIGMRIPDGASTVAVEKPVPIAGWSSILTKPSNSVTLGLIGGESDYTFGQLG